MRRASAGYLRGLLICLLAVALVALGTGLGHRTAAQVPDEALLAYAMPDGTLPTLCLTGEGGHPTSGQDDRELCSACVLGHKLALPARLAAPSRTGLGLRFATIALIDTATGSIHAPRAPPARGPPLSLIL